MKQERQFDWNALRAFAALADTGTLVSAASQVNSSAATVQRQILSLECGLGATLFVRSRTGHQLTGSGRELRSLVTTIEHGMAGIGDTIGNDARKLEGSVTIATTELGADMILAPRLPAFLAAHPGIDIRFDVSPAHADLLNLQTAIALRFARPRKGDFTIRALRPIPFGLYRSPDMAGNDIVGWSDSHRNIAPARWLDAAYPEARQRVRAPSIAMHQVLARAGVGQAMLPEFMADGLECAAQDEDWRLESWLIVPTRLKSTARVRRVAEFVVSAVQEISLSARSS